jgi:hypothetical protein
MADLGFTDGYALIIGVGADLPITVQDAQALHDVIVDPNRAAYPPHQVDLLTEASADRHGVLAAFDRLIERVEHNPDATVIVYFSGHGGRIEHAHEPPEYFLVPYGYDPSRRAETAVSGLEFTRKVEAIQARKLVVLLDCCHAGGVPALKEPGQAFVKSPVPPELLAVLASGSGRVVVASSHEHEYSYTGAPYSVFTTCLLEALGGRAAVNPDGYARILDVLIYLFKHVPERASGPQHPFVKKVLDLGDNFPLCYYAGGDKRVAPGAPVASEVTMPRPLTAGQRRRLGQRMDALEQEWQLRSEKVRRMRAALAVEASVAVKFQLEQQLLEEESMLAQVGSELDQIERVLH